MHVFATGWAVPIRASHLRHHGDAGPVGTSLWRQLESGFYLHHRGRGASGCTSGHGISGLADLQRGSLIATTSLFASGLMSCLRDLQLAQPRVAQPGVPRGVQVGRQVAVSTITENADDQALTELGSQCLCRPHRAARRHTIELPRL